MFRDWLKIRDNGLVKLLKFSHDLHFSLVQNQVLQYLELLVLK